MWAENEFAESVSLRKAPYKNTFSNNSYIFDVNGEEALDKREGLKEIFDICNKKMFDMKFQEACDGSANESTRITTVHSSSLCALLFFYNVTEKNPLILDIDGKNTIFTESIFEFQNTVIPGRNPSNVDVVLLGKRDGRKVILFLESKFSEYYQGTGTSLNIAKEYLNKEIPGSEIYNSSSCLKMLGLKKETALCDSEFKIQADETMYLEGIKQMTSHYAGICHFMNGKSNVPECAKQKKVRDYYDSETFVYLGTILFDKYIGKLPIGKKHMSCLKSYQKYYKILASYINQDRYLPKRFKMLDNILKYSLFENNRHETELNIRKFYFG